MGNNRDEFPHLGHSGNRVLNELLWQIHDNPKNSDLDRAFFTTLLGWVTDEFDSLHDVIKAAEMQGLRNPAFTGDEIGNWLDSDEREDKSA